MTLRGWRRAAAGVGVGFALAFGLGYVALEYLWSLF